MNWMAATQLNEAGNDVVLRQVTKLNYATKAQFDAFVNFSIRTVPQTMWTGLEVSERWIQSER